MFQPNIDDILAVSIFLILQKMLPWTLLYMSPMHLCQSLPTFYLELELRVVGEVHVHLTDHSFFFDSGLHGFHWFYCPLSDVVKSHARLASPQELLISSHTPLLKERYKTILGCLQYSKQAFAGMGISL